MVIWVSMNSYVFTFPVVRHTLMVEPNGSRESTNAESGPAICDAMIFYPSGNQRKFEEGHPPPSNQCIHQLAAEKCPPSRLAAIMT